jgi:thiol-disulfide isomerase/thioredoxin
LTFVYEDKKSAFWKKYWNRALILDDFIEGTKPNEKEQWNDRKKRVPDLTNDQIERLQGYNRELNVFMYSGGYCGDCSRQAPMLQKMCDAAGDKVNFKVIEREGLTELQDELRILGALRVPVVVFLTEDFWEVGRFGERLLSVYRSKAAREIGRGRDQGVLTSKALRRETSEWLDIFERMLIMVRLSPPLRQRHND